MDPKVKQALTNAQKLIIVTTAKSDLDALFAAFALALSLAGSGKEVKLLLAHKKQNQVIFSKLSPNLKNLLLDTSQKIFKISLKGADFAIKNINLQKIEDNYNIYLSSSNESAGVPELTVAKSPWPSDLVIAVGVEETDTLLKFQLYQDREVDFTKTLGIGQEKNRPEYPLFFTLKGNSSVSIIVTSFLLANNLPLPREAATYLLAGLYWKTDSFKYHVQDDFATADFLIKNGAVQKKAKVLGLHNLHFHQLPYFQELFNNFQLSAEGIYYSIIAQETKRLGQELFNDLIPLAEVFDAKVAFVVLEDELFNTVYLKSNISDFNLLDFVKPYNGEGNHSQAYFISSMSTGKLVEKLTADLNQLLNKRQRRVEDNLAVPVKKEISLKKQAMEPEKPAAENVTPKKLQPVEVKQQQQEKKRDNKILPKPEQKIEQKQEQKPKPKTEQKQELKTEEKIEQKPKQEPKQIVKNPVTGLNRNSISAKPQKQPVKPENNPGVNYDPLAPATSLPQPLKLGNEESIQLAQPIVQTPLAPGSG